MSSRMAFRHFPVVLAGPSGAGKTTIVRELVAFSSEFVFSVSVTTRPPREGEEAGSDYEFVTDEAFESMVERGELAEWAEVHGRMYGTPRSSLEKAMREECFVLLDIDVQGARQIRERVSDSVLIFILPPSIGELEERLSGRATEVAEEVQRRFRTALGELEAGEDFDYIVVNDDLQQSVTKVRAIVAAESCRPRRLRDLPAEVARYRSAIDRLVGSEGAPGVGRG